MRFFGKLPVKSIFYDFFLHLSLLLSTTCDKSNKSKAKNQIDIQKSGHIVKLESKGVSNQSEDQKKYQSGFSGYEISGTEKRKRTENEDCN